MGKGIYVIVELGWEYNDEYYHRPECGGGTPKMFFTEEEKALAQVTVNQMNSKKRQNLAGDSSWEYTASQDGITIDELDFYQLLYVPYFLPQRGDLNV